MAIAGRFGRKLYKLTHQTSSGCEFNAHRVVPHRCVGVCRMGEDVPRQDYRAKADEAEKLALQSTDLVTRNNLLRAAQRYRSLDAFIRSKARQ